MYIHTDVARFTTLYVYMCNWLHSIVEGFVSYIHMGMLVPGDHHWNLSWASAKQLDVITDVLSVIDLTDYGGESSGDGSQDPPGYAFTSIVPSMLPVANETQVDETLVANDTLVDVQMPTQIDSDFSDSEFWANEVKAGDDESFAELLESPPKKITCVIPN